MTSSTLRSIATSGSVLLLGALAAGPLAAAPQGGGLSTAPIVNGAGVRTSVVPRPSEVYAGAEGWLWSRTLQSPGSSFMKAHLVNVNLRRGDVLTLRSRTGHVVEEITGRGPKDMGTFWSLSAFGDELALELSFSEPYGYVPFRIDEVILGDPSILEDQPSSWSSICSPEDFDDVLCFQSDPGKWSNVLASVGVMSVGGNPSFSLFCSGSNVSPMNYLLTNDHCLSTQSQCNNTEFVFKFYRQGCNNSAPTTPDWQSFRCDTIVAGSPFISCDQGLGDLDFSLSTVIGDPAATFGHVDPDPVPITDGEAIYIIQHPAGRPHEIAHGTGVNVDADGTVLRYYDTLDTEGGSSGSPIYRESDDKLIGLHHCGGCTTPGTGNRGMLMSDIYPLIQDFLCSPVPDLVGQEAGVLEPGLGNGDTVVDPGEVWNLRPVLTNAACTAVAVDVRARVRLNPASVGGVTFLEDRVSFGSIAGGVTAAAIEGVRFQVERGTPCDGQLIFDLYDIQAAGGGAHSDALAFSTIVIGDAPITTLLAEGFATGGPDWSIVDNGEGPGPASTWTTANPGNRTLALNAPFYIVDSGMHRSDFGGGYLMDEELVSPVIDLGGYTTVELQFAHDFNWGTFSLDEQGDVDVRSSATGGAWVTVANFSGADFSGVVSLDITAQAANRSDVQVRFHYYNAQLDWWWAVDDVFVLGDRRSCNPVGIKLGNQGSGGANPF